MPLHRGTRRTDQRDEVVPRIVAVAGRLDARAAHVELVGALAQLLDAELRQVCHSCCVVLLLLWWWWWWWQLWLLLRWW